MTVAKTWRSIPETYNLIGKKCTECNSLYFPVREVCKSCGNHRLENHRFKGKGKIETFTIIRTPSMDSDKENIEVAARDIPYVMAIVSLEEGPRLTTQIVDCAPDQVKIGQQVELVFRKIKEQGKKGVIQYGYKFRLEEI